MPRILKAPDTRPGPMGRAHGPGPDRTPVKHVFRIATLFDVSPMLWKQKRSTEKFKVNYWHQKTKETNNYQHPLWVEWQRRWRRKNFLATSIHCSNRTQRLNIPCRHPLLFDGNHLAGRCNSIWEIIFLYSERKRERKRYQHVLIEPIQYRLPELQTLAVPGAGTV